MLSGILVLAAGRSSRFGADKRRAVLPGGSQVMETTLANAAESGLPVRVCIAIDDLSLGEDLESQGFQVCRCARSVEGMGASLAEGVASLPAWEGVLIALGDMPWIMPATYRRLAQGLAANAIRVPVYRGQRGHPVGIGRDFWPELQQLQGDTGARRVLERHVDSVEELPVRDEGVLRDIDEPADIPGN